MIASIKLTNFKCFEQQTLVTRPLTLLAGVNSSGKSTIIQALLLLRQSYLESLLPNIGLALNGKLVQMGTAKDVLFEEADTDEIGLGIEYSTNTDLSINLSYQEESDVLGISDLKQNNDPWKTSLFEPPRLSWRLQQMRRWSHDEREDESIFA